jgi:hypothetical protein
VFLDVRVEPHGSKLFGFSAVYHFWMVEARILFRYLKKSVLVGKYSLSGASSDECDTEDTSLNEPHWDVIRMAS